MATIKHTPEDFEVEEVPLYEPTGEGEHTFLWVEKRDLTTARAVGLLAAELGVPARELGYAGMKDRRAVCRQFISVPRVDPRAVADLELEGLRVLAARRHVNKLRTGHLRGNRFTVVVRDLESSPEVIGARLERRAQCGFANLFGAQRFGRHGGNAARGLDLLCGRRRYRDRRTERLMISALQSDVFNRVVRERLEQAGESDDLSGLTLPRRGDVARIEASGGLFLVGDPSAEQDRVARWEISLTGPIFGLKTLMPEGEPLELERVQLERAGVPDLAVVPRRLRRWIQGARRPLRARPSAITSAAVDRSTLKLQFELPRGCFATALLQSLLDGEELVSTVSAGGSVDRVGHGERERGDLGVEAAP